MLDPTSFTRGFQHQDWTDNVDRVQADGPNGFNVRFHALEAEFDKLYTIASQLNTSLGVLGGIVRRSITLTFTPNFSGGSQAQFNWNLVDGAAITPALNTPNNIDGWLPLQLPDGTQVQNITVFGSKKGSLGSFQILLVQQSIVNQGQQQVMSNIQLNAVPDGPFQQQGVVPDNLKAVNNSNFKYLVFAIVTPANPLDNTATARINAIQVVCNS